MSHEGGDDGEIDAPIHQVSGEAVAQRPRRNALWQCGPRHGRTHDLADIVVADTPCEMLGTKERATPAVLEEVREQLAVHPIGDRKHARPIALGVANVELLALAHYIGNIQRTKLCRAQPTAVKQQDHEPVAPFLNAAARTGTNEPFGLFHGEEVRLVSLHPRMQVQPVEDVALGAAAAPGVLEESAQVARLLGERGLGSATLALRLEPAQVILERELPQRHLRTAGSECLRGTFERAAHIDHGARDLAADVAQVAEVPLDQWVERVHAASASVWRKPLIGWRAMASRRAGSAMCV